MEQAKQKRIETARRRYLITTIRQVDGGIRELYAATATAATAEREALRRDPAMIDAIDWSEYVDVDRDGYRIRHRRRDSE